MQHAPNATPRPARARIPELFACPDHESGGWRLEMSVRGHVHVVARDLDEADARQLADLTQSFAGCSDEDVTAASQWLVEEQYRREHEGRSA